MTGLLFSTGACSAMAPFRLVEPRPLLVHFETGQTARNPFSIAGGTAPYQASWVHKPPPHALTSGSICDDPKLQVTDANGCVTIIDNCNN